MSAPSVRCGATEAGPVDGTGDGTVDGTVVWPPVIVAVVGAPVVVASPDMPMSPVGPLTGSAVPSATFACPGAPAVGVAATGDAGAVGVAAAATAASWLASPGGSTSPRAAGSA